MALGVPGVPGVVVLAEPVVRHSIRLFRSAVGKAEEPDAGESAIVATSGACADAASGDRDTPSAIPDIATRPIAMRFICSDLSEIGYLTDLIEDESE
ncbi:hypothetical protein GCM10027262_75420 [Nocardia tengchongensis]